MFKLVVAAVVLPESMTFTVEDITCEFFSFNSICVKCKCGSVFQNHNSISKSQQILSQVRSRPRLKFVSPAHYSCPCNSVFLVHSTLTALPLLLYCDSL